MGSVLKFCLAFLLFASTSCESESRVSSPQVPFSEFLNAKRGRESRDIRVAGIFDLKSICLNFNPHYKPNGDFCRAYFSEHGGTNAPSQEVSLRVCHHGVSTNCIDPLPENAPPELIVIRDSGGEQLEQWGRVVIEARISSADTLTGVEVLTIDSAN